jgi:hypothetical protein
VRARADGRMNDILLIIVIAACFIATIIGMKARR